MSTNQEYARILREKEGYTRDIVAFALCDEEPTWAENYGDDVSFECAIFAEAWERDRPFYITCRNIICGGSVYSGLGSVRRTKEEFDAGMEGTAIGKHGAYATRQVFRRVNQQIPHHFKHHPYLVIGKLQDVPAPDAVMVVTDANRVMRLCKVYTWTTGELVEGIAGTAWCANSIPLIYRTRTMTFNMGDPPSRVMMGLEPGEMYCFIHYDLLPLIVENFDNISDGQVL